jgi:hypothetical protein
MAEYESKNLRWRFRLVEGESKKPSLALQAGGKRDKRTFAGASG